MAAMTGPGEVRTARRPWAAVPRAVAEPLHPALPAAIEHVIEVVTKEVAAYGGTNERVAATLRAGVGMALGRLVDLMGTDEEALGEAAGLYVRIGAGEYHAGRGLADLLSAYQIGARAAWQSLSRAGVAAGVTPQDVSLLAEAVFAYIDQLSAASIAGYTQAQLADAGRREALRSELVERLLAGGARSDRVSALAAEVQWPLPPTAAGVLPRQAELPAALPGALAGRTAEGAVALVPGPASPGLRAWLARATPPVAVGLPVELSDVGRSLAHARALLDLPVDGSLLAADHLAELLVRADPDLGVALRQDVLAAFDVIPPARRQPLLDTLRSWLLHAGNRGDVGADLHVHPQTVSYRMDRVRDVLGDRLDDPQSRWELLLALKTQGVSGRPAGP
jgi:hypothetical protein